MYDVLSVFGGAIIFSLVLLAFQYKRRYEIVHYSMGMDMRGFNESWRYGEKIHWIMSRPDYRSCINPHDVLSVWEKREKVLDTEVETRC